MTRHERQLTQLSDGTLDPSDFNHADHVGVAFEAIRRHGPVQGPAVVADGLRALTDRAGVPEKFHTTITIAFLSLIAERQARGDYDGAKDFLDRNRDLLDRNLLAGLYSPDRLGSALARSMFLLPDRHP